MNVKIDNTSLKSYVYNEIKQMIYAGKFPLDQKINKAELAEHFNSSLTPINDALNRLVGEKFLTLESRKGYFVREFSVEEMIEFCDGINSEIGGDTSSIREVGSMQTEWKDLREDVVEESLPNEKILSNVHGERGYFAVKRVVK